MLFDLQRERVILAATALIHPPSSGLDEKLESPQLAGAQLDFRNSLLEVSTHCGLGEKDSVFITIG